MKTALVIRTKFFVNQLLRSIILLLVPMSLLLHWTLHSEIPILSFQYQDFSSIVDCTFSKAEDESGTSIYALKSNSSYLDLDLVVVPIEPFQACDWRIETITCSVTILLEQNRVFPLPQVTDPAMIDQVCTNLIDGSNGATDIVQVPVCLQNSNSLGVLAYYHYGHGQEFQKGVKNGKHSNDDGLNSYIQMVLSSDEPAVRNFVESDRVQMFDVRIVPLKRVDMPFYYQRPWFGGEWEIYRDDNYGNMVWRYASTMILNQATVHYKLKNNIPWTQIVDPDVDKVDALVVATANTLHLTEEPKLQELIEAMVERVRTRNVPTVVLGLGIQSEFKDENDAGSNTSYGALRTISPQDLKLPHTYQTHLLREISLRQSIPAIGVRGDLTKTVCENSGISQCVSMGCPSLTISRDINLGRTLQNKWDYAKQKLRTDNEWDLNFAITVPAYPSDPPSKPVYAVMELIATLIERYGPDRITVISQTPDTENTLNGYITNEWKKKYPNTGLSNSSVRYEEYYNVESWLIGAKKYDLCVSSRIHGSMVFIGAGIPTIGIPTDFRILELISAMKVPHILPEAVQKILDESSVSTDTSRSSTNNEILLSLMEHSENTNFTEFEMNRRSKIKGWKSILHAAGLEIDPSLSKIINTPLVW